MTGTFDSSNRLFAQAQQGRRLPTIPVALAVVPAMLALMIVTQIVMRLLFRSLLGDEPVADSIAELLGFLSIFLGLWVLVHFWTGCPFRSLGFQGPHAFRNLLCGSLIAGVVIGPTIGLVMIPGATIGPGELQIRGIAALAIGLLTLLATSVQSSAEEALFRGWLLPVIGVRRGPLTAVILSGFRHGPCNHGSDRARLGESVSFWSDGRATCPGRGWAVDRVRLALCLELRAGGACWDSRWIDHSAPAWLPLCKLSGPATLLAARSVRRAELS